MDREEEGGARRSVRERWEEAIVVWWDDGTDEKSRGREGGGDGWRGKTLLLHCVAAPEQRPVPLQHSASSPFV
ncbi:hypothetical protein PBY51_023457 [Eleginops maclovinus]|uniref:Uncharacterized protein n=1 Tax=Eleginops maclovinus TaxID=56733 RepID=A0AAN7WYD6_ELEMC|nr:hypothetical protein PBY51_023457 [Eleginops maclovinus]